MPTSGASSNEILTAPMATSHMLTNSSATNESKRLQLNNRCPDGAKSGSPQLVCNCPQDANNNGSAKRFHVVAPLEFSTLANSNLGQRRRQIFLNLPIADNSF